MLFLPLERLQDLPIEFDPRSIGGVLDYLEDYAGDLVEEVRNRNEWPEAIRAITGYAMHPHDYITRLLLQLSAAVLTIRSHDVASPALVAIVNAYNPQRVRPAGLGLNEWVEELSRGAMTRTVIDKLGLEGVAYAVCYMWYVWASVDQPGSRQWRLAQVAQSE